MKLGTMLGMGFFAVIVVCVCVAAFGWMKLHDQGEQLRVLAEERETLEVEWLEAASILE
jgi:methyl-accepting chemotaxis protein